MAHASVSSQSSSLLGKAHSSAVNAVAAAAAAGSPVSRSGGQRGSKDPQGKQLSGEAQLEYQIEAQSAGKTRLQLEVAVVTVYGTDNTRELRQFVAANAAYICYGLRNGPVRVLDRNTGGRALLRGLTAPVLDLSFFRGSQDLLASAGKDQQLIVWRLSPGTAGSLIGQQVLAVRLASGTAETQPRLAWHPTSANILFFTAGSHVLLCHIGEAAAVASQIDLDVNSLPEGVVCLPPSSSASASSSLTSIAISEDGMMLAASSSDGVVHVWKLTQVDSDTASVSSLVGNMTAMPPVQPSGQPTGSLVWTILPAPTGDIARAATGLVNALLVGNENNSEIALFAAPSDRDGLGASSVTPGLQRVQTLSLVSASEPHPHGHLVSAPSAGLVILASATSPIVLAIKLTGGDERRGPGFSTLAEFAVKSPILSLSALVDESSDNDSGCTVTLFAMQAAAVQQFSLNPLLCDVPASPSAPAAESAATPQKPTRSTSLQSSASQQEAIRPTTAAPHRLHMQSHGSTPGPAPSVSLSPMAASADQRAADHAAFEVQRSDEEDSSDKDEGDDALQQTNGIPQVNSSSSIKTPMQSKTAAAISSDSADQGQGDATARPDGHAFDASAHSSGGSAPAMGSPAASVSSSRLLTPGQLLQQVRIDRLSTDHDAVPPHSPASPALSLGSVSLGGASMVVQASASPASTVVNAATPSVSHIEGPEAGKGTRLPKRASDAVTAPSPATPDPQATSSTLAAPSPATPPLSDANSNASTAAILASQAENQKRLVGHLNANYRDVLKAMRGELSKETRRMEAAMDNRLAAALTAFAAQSRAERDAAAAASSQQLTQLLTSFSQGLNRSLPAHMDDCVRREVGNIAAGIGAVVAPAVRAAIAQTPLPQARPAALPARPVTLDSKEIAERLQASLAAPLTAAVHASIKRQLLPPMEAAIQEGFRQMDVSLGAGFREHAETNAAPFSATAASLQNVLSQATALSNGMKTDLVDGHRLLLDAAAAVSKAVASVGFSQQQQEVEASPDPTIEISALVAEERYEEAFTMALGLANVSLVTWLCQQLDPSILSQDPVVLSQGVLLSLLQQLGSDLTNSPSQVLLWIRDAALALDPQAPQLAGHMRPVLEELFAALQVRAAAVASAPGGTGGPSEAAVLRLVIHVVNSLRMQCT